MNTINIGVNGFGRIGRQLTKLLLGSKNFKLSAINDLSDSNTSSHLFKYDTSYGSFNGEVNSNEDQLIINGKKIHKFSEKDPSKINWSDCGVDIVIESTGIFTNKSDAEKHLQGSVKKVIISAPATNEDVTIVLGVNDDAYDTKKHNIISNASCTTNCLAPLAKVVDDNFGIEEALMTTVHATTATQLTVDGPSRKDYRGGRSALMNIIPASTGAAKAVGKVIPKLDGKLTGMAFRVPTADVSVVDLTVKTQKETSLEEIKAAFKAASEGPMNGVLGYTDELVVSQDFVSDARTSIFDADAAIELNSTFFKLVSWYDNEFGYSNKLVDLAQKVNSL